MTKTWVLVIGVIVAVLAIAAVACSDDDDATPEETNAQLCADLAGLSVALAAYGDIDLDSTKAELEAATQAVDDAVNNVSSSSQAVADIRVADVEAAVGELDQAVRDVSDDMTISEGLDSISDEAAAVDAALLGLFSEAGCA